MLWPYLRHGERLHFSYTDMLPYLFLYHVLISCHSLFPQRKCSIGFYTMLCRADKGIRQTSKVTAEGNDHYGRILVHNETNNFVQECKWSSLTVWITNHKSNNFLDFSLCNVDLETSVLSKELSPVQIKQSTNKWWQHWCSTKMQWNQ